MTVGVHTDTQGRFVVEGPGSFAGAIENLLNAFNSLWGDFSGLFSPVVGVYGAFWTMALIGLLLFSLGYWIFIRN